MSESKETYKGSNFIRNIIIKDLEEGKNEGRVHTRFPPEPNGYLHIGHAKSICLNFGMAEEFGGKCNLRFDDTNPLKEDTEYVESIRRDVKWLGFDWEDREYFASDYFGKFYEYAVQLVRDGLAFVDDLTAEEIRQYRGSLTEPGRESPYRNRSVEENLDLLERMKKGEFKDGEKVLRAKIDMSSPNINMRDPVIYRIAHAEHHNTGNDWCIYPMYDFAHGLEDSIEGITHSICTLEFEDHRPLYDWFLEKLGVYHPQQIEFARLNLTNTVMSKRKLLKLVQDKYVNGWDDPRMPTIAGLRRRGFTPESIRMFTDMIGVSKSNSIIEYSLLENCLRDDLNKRAHRRMAVIDPLKMVIINYPEDKEELLEAENNPENEADGKRMIPFSRELYIEREDFMENPPKKYFRLFPGGEIRLKHAYYVTCVNVVKDAEGNVTEVHCTYDPASKGGWTEDGRKVRGTSHWVSARHAVRCEVRIYDNLFIKENPDDVEEGQDFTANISPDSLKITGCWGEPSLAEAAEFTSFQFLRQGYFVADPDTSKEKPVFNRTVSLKDSWAKEQQKG
ncbi:glutamine--tRNA ligase/YqeY domain fusion protein [Geovibrio ferrireducens]|jgi:glutaminyl-tRNA synthetase|uniref:glutamine--tRNA ligase/YqeY domain fusion protein n=1 Tax=Geovibrio ferrireducens TaxID=46201 RepID=UPI002246E3D1|nr:glutamine--tRNA ligase/YqeY domain fusion protein [Geovibrio ferrireducens]